MGLITKRYGAACRQGACRGRLCVWPGGRPPAARLATPLTVHHSIRSAAADFAGQDLEAKPQELELLLLHVRLATLVLGHPAPREARQRCPRSSCSGLLYARGALARDSHRAAYRTAEATGARVRCCRITAGEGNGEGASLQDARLLDHLSFMQRHQQPHQRSAQPQSCRAPCQRQLRVGGRGSCSLTPGRRRRQERRQGPSIRLLMRLRCLPSRFPCTVAGIRASPPTQKVLPRTYGPGNAAFLVPHLLHRTHGGTSGRHLSSLPATFPHSARQHRDTVPYDRAIHVRPGCHHRPHTVRAVQPHLRCIASTTLAGGHACSAITTHPANAIRATDCCKGGGHWPSPRRACSCQRCIGMPRHEARSASWGQRAHQPCGTTTACVCATTGSRGRGCGCMVAGCRCALRSRGRSVALPVSGA